MSDVIGFTDFIKNRAIVAPRGMETSERPQHVNFTRRDREDFDDWSTDEHRVSVCSSELGVFAMVYQAGQSWASWGLVRQGRSVLLWDCVSLADIGRFSSMIDALAAIPLDKVPVPVANVIQFGAARVRTAPIG